MGEVVRIVRIDIQESKSGLLCASSRDLPGMMVMHRDIRRIRADLPNVIKKLIKRREGRDVEVREVAPATADDRRLVPDLATIPLPRAA